VVDADDGEMDARGGSFLPGNLPTPDAAASAAPAAAAGPAAATAAVQNAARLCLRDVTYAFHRQKRFIYT
jgi:hypothetical protein